MFKKALPILMLCPVLLLFYTGKTGSQLPPPPVESTPAAAFVVEAETIAERTERCLMGGTSAETTLHIIQSPREGPVVMVVGGVHGNEPAGFLAADNISGWSVDRGTLLVLPRANVSAIAAKSRNAPGEADLNRVFPGNPKTSGTRRLAAEIRMVMDEFQPAWVVDLHEAVGLERLQPGALGQTIIYPRQGSSLDMAGQVLETVNNSSSSQIEKFILRRGAVRGSLVEAAVILGLEGLLIESYQGFPLEDRIEHHRRVVYTLLYQLNMHAG